RCRRAASVAGAGAPGGTAGKAGGRAGAIGVWGTQRCERGLGGGARPAAAAIGGKVLAVPQHLREPWAERVAIMVMDGGLPREEAERLAWNWLQAPGAAATAHTLRVTVCSGAVPPGAPRQRLPRASGGRLARAGRQTAAAGPAGGCRALLELGNHLVGDKPYGVHYYFTRHRCRPVDLEHNLVGAEVFPEKVDALHHFLRRPKQVGFHGGIGAG